MCFAAIDPRQLSVSLSDTSIDHIRILSIGLELARNGGYCRESFSNANYF